MLVVGFSFVAPELLEHNDALDPRPSIAEIIEYNLKVITSNILWFFFQ